MQRPKHLDNDWEFQFTLKKHRERLQSIRQGKSRTLDHLLPESFKHLDKSKMHPQRDLDICRENEQLLSRLRRITAKKTTVSIRPTVRRSLNYRTRRQRTLTIARENKELAARLGNKGPSIRIYTFEEDHRKYRETQSKSDLAFKTKQGSPSQEGLFPIIEKKAGLTVQRKKLAPYYQKNLKYMTRRPLEYSRSITLSSITPSPDLGMDLPASSRVLPEGL